jgi:hypothetical protein
LTANICPSCGLTVQPGAVKCRCGRTFAAEPPPATPLGPPAAPDAMIPKTVIRKATPGPAGAVPPVPGPAEGFSLPQAGRNEQIFTPSTPTPLPGRMPQPTQPPRTVPGARRLFPGGAAYFFKSVAALLFLVGLAGGAGYLYLQRQHMKRPDVVVPILAQRYLQALSQSDFATAYEMFSPQAKAQSSIDDFRQLRDTTPWTWSNISIVSIEPDAVTLQYDLALEGRAPQKDYLLFVLEGESWVRPYNWGLIKKTEQAFDRGDPDMAMLLSQAAVSVNPRDPMARGYLCEAGYYRKLAAAAQKECEAALELAKKYPSKLTPKSLYHLHAILGDTYKNAVRRPDLALEQYALMLQFPNLSVEDQCELLLARTDAFLQLSRPQDASNDLSRASGLCAKPEDQEFIARKRAELSAR